MHRRRNRDINILGLAGPLAGLAVLLTIFSPQARQALAGLGIIVVSFVGLVALICIALVAYRHLDREPNPYAGERSLDCRTQLSAAVQDSQPSTTAELITQLRSIDWYQFEKIVALVYRKSGYVVTSRGGANPDGGIDLILEKDGQRTAVQCKQWKTWDVGVKAVREFLGALKDAGIDQGIFITLKGYTGDAKLLADKHRIEILNETGLAEMLESTNARFDPETLAILQDQQKYCPKCESEMIVRTTKKGGNAGHQFLGCSNYPQCRFTLNT